MKLVRSLSCILTIGGAIALGGACSDPEVEAAVRALGEGCLIDSDCQDELVCVFRRCHVQCETNKDCVDAGLSTNCSTEQPVHVCLLPDEQECQRHRDCPSERMVCHEGQCEDRCEGDNDCNVDSVCGPVGTCEPADSPTDPPGEGTVEEDGLCRYNSQCVPPLICRSGFCEVECLAKVDCADDQECDEATGRCVTPGSGGTPGHCQNGVLDGDESDADCGGSCGPCPSGNECTAAGDCASGVCTGSLCQVPACDDGVRNGFETDVDCGGPACAACAAGSVCTQQSDCAAGDICDLPAGICVGPTCLDGVLNGDETGADCGGSCAPCDNNQPCITPGDCTSLVCGGGTCQAPTCGDGVQNGDESDVDCGGTLSGCAACNNGGECVVPSDCETLNCTMAGTCAPPACDDGVQNGFELGLDCGGGCPAGCPVGTTCLSDADCVSSAGCHPVSGMCEGRFDLTVTYAGGGQGTVTSSLPVGAVDCSGTCTLPFFDNENITLDGSPIGGDSFDGFTGDCVGVSSCTFQINGADAAVTAAFSPGVLFDPRFQDVPGNLNNNGNFGVVDVDGANHVLIGGEFQGVRFFGGLELTASFYDGFVYKLRADGTAAWAVNEGGPGAGRQETTALGVDGNDNVLAGFTFSGTANPTFGGQVLTCPINAFAIVKYSSAGAAVWSRCHGQGATASRVRDIVGDSNGDVIVVGDYSGANVDFGDGATHSSNGTSWFLARYSGVDGTAIAGETFTFAADSNNVDRTLGSVEVFGGDVLVAGSCTHGDTIGGVVINNAQGSGSVDICVAKLDETTLAADWAQGYGGSADDNTNQAAFAPGGRVILGGWFASSITFTDGVANTQGGTDMIFIELDRNTGLLFDPGAGNSWDTHGTTGADDIVDIVVTSLGAVYAIGHTTPGLDFNPADGEPPLTDRNVLVKFASFGVYAGALATGDLDDSVVALGLMTDGSLAFTGITGGNAVKPDWGHGEYIINEQFVEGLGP